MIIKSLQTRFQRLILQNPKQICLKKCITHHHIIRGKSFDHGKIKQDKLLFKKQKKNSIRIKPGCCVKIGSNT